MNRTERCPVDQVTPQIQRQDEDMQHFFSITPFFPDFLRQVTLRYKHAVLGQIVITCS